MARCSADDQNADDPIVLPLLRNDPTNLALHDQIYLDMQNCVLEPIKSRMHDIHGNTSNQQIWSPARDITQDNDRARNWHNIVTDPGANVDDYRAYNTDKNPIHPHSLTSISYESKNNDDAAGTARTFIPIHCDGKNTMSAMERLANHSRKLYNENADRDIHMGAMEVNNSEFRRGVWPTYPGAGHYKSSLNYYGIQPRSDESDNSTDKSSDMYDDPDK